MFRKNVNDTGYQVSVYENAEHFHDKSDDKNWVCIALEHPYKNQNS
jgi:hypothetical protein